MIALGDLITVGDGCKNPDLIGFGGRVIDIVPDEDGSPLYIAWLNQPYVTTWDTYTSWVFSKDELMKGEPV